MEKGRSAIFVFQAEGFFFSFPPFFSKSGEGRGLGIRVR